MNFKRIEHLKKAFLLVGALLISLISVAQKESESVDKYRAVYTYEQPSFTTNNDSDATPVITHQALSPDEYGVYYEFDNELIKLLELHKSTNSATTEGPGFRIQIYAGSKMELANGTKADFVQSFGHDDYSVYQNWQPPHFRVRVGDFLSRQEAMRELATIRQVFPDAFVVIDQINLPKFKKQLIKAGLPENQTEDRPN